MLRLFIVMLLLSACSRPRIVDPVHPWPESGVAEADSLLVAFERVRLLPAPTPDQRNRIVERFCSVAAEHPGNRMLGLRRIYMECCTLASSDPREVYERIGRETLPSDSALYPYEMHILGTLRLPYEKSIYRKYMFASANAEFFGKEGAEVELARNLVLKGNALTELADTSAALVSFGRAEEIFSRHGAEASVRAVRLNRLPLLSRREGMEVLDTLLRDSIVRNTPKLYIPVLQTAYYMNDSVELLDRAIAISSEEGVDRGVSAILLAMKASALVLEEKYRQALSMTGAIRRAEEEDTPSTRYRPVIHNNLAMVYEAAGMKDSCIYELVEAADWTDSLHRESNYRKIYANEARMHIEAMRRNAALELQNILMWWGISLAVAGAVALIIYFRLRRKVEKRRYEIERLDEKIENERRLNFAQASVIEQNERMISELNSAMEKLTRDSLLSPEAKIELSHLVSTYQSNEESRKGFLKVSREVENTFSRRLKEEYPEISESQLRLASLIAAGIDSQQLAAILNISSKSLYTSRYRLRMRLGLPKEASLEDFLRRFAGTSRQS